MVCSCGGDGSNNTHIYMFLAHTTHRGSINTVAVKKMKKARGSVVDERLQKKFDACQLMQIQNLNQQEGIEV